MSSLSRICIIFAMTCVSSFGATIFSNLVEPGDLYGPDPVGIGHTPAFPQPGSFVTYAVKFTPTAEYRLTSFSAPLAVVSGPNQIEAYLYTDSGGQPGSILETYVLTNLPAAGPGTGLTTVDSTLDPILMPGQQYWIAATGGGSTFGVWTLNLFQGNSADGGASVTTINGLAGSWTVGSGTRTGALVVSGDLVVPEPTSLGLVVLGGLWLAYRRRHVPSMQH